MVNMEALNNLKCKLEAFKKYGGRFIKDKTGDTNDDDEEVDGVLKKGTKQFVSKVLGSLGLLLGGIGSTAAAASAYMHQRWTTLVNVCLGKLGISLFLH